AALTKQPPQSPPPQSPPPPHSGPLPMPGSPSQSRAALHQGPMMSLRGGGAPRTGGGSGAPNAGHINAGGGLDAGIRFDNLNFNWDAFFTQFIADSQKDMRLWRRAMRQLQMMSRESAASM